MKQSLLIGFAAIVTMVLSVTPVSAEVQPLSDRQIAAVRAHCGEALRSISQVQKTEAASRVNRGRVYERTMKLVTALNSRAALNKLDTPVLTNVTARLQAKLDNFHEDYLDYAAKMDSALAINCRQAPVSFYDSLALSREARGQVAKDIADISSLLDEYQKGLNELKALISSVENGEQLP